MPENKTKTKADEKLIKKLFKFNPIDWARYPDGHIVCISPEGRKLSLSREEIEAGLKSDKAQQKDAVKLSS